MSWLRQFLFKFTALFRRRQLEQDMAEELALHLEERMRRNVAAGMDAEQARYAAQREFGGVEQVKERLREERTWLWVDALRRDFLYALRLLRRSPLFTATTVSSLILCLGINAAIYSALRGLVLNPLPFTAADDIVDIYNSAPKIGVGRFESNLGQYLDFKANAPALATLALWDTNPDVLTDTSDATHLVTAVVSDEFFRLIDVQPLAGRFFTRENLAPGSDHVLVLTESYWRSQFRGDLAAIGQTVRLNGVLYEIIGIAPKAVEALDAKVRAIRPYTLPSEKLADPNRTEFYVSLIGRVAPGATLAEAQAQLARLERIYYMGAANQQGVLDRTGMTIHVERLAKQRSAPIRVALWLLQVGAVLVLVIGTINVINLFLARSNARQREFQTRAALGASWRDLVHQLWMEASVVGACGIAGGLAFAWVGLTIVNIFTASLLSARYR